MTEIKLSKAEAAILTDAAGQSGRIAIPATMKPGTGERFLGRLLRDKLANMEGEHHVLTAAGYRGVGLTPPPVAGSRKAQVLDLLRREDGASLAELIAATGWLPHTTRAALSRIRSGDGELVKSIRPDGTTAYRLAPEPIEPASKPKRVRRARDAGASAVAA